MKVNKESLEILEKRMEELEESFDVWEAKMEATPKEKRMDMASEFTKLNDEYIWQKKRVEEMKKHLGA